MKRRDQPFWPVNDRVNSSRILFIQAASVTCGLFGCGSWILSSSFSSFARCRVVLGSRPSHNVGVRLKVYALHSG